MATKKDRKTGGPAAPTQNRATKKPSSPGAPQAKTTRAKKKPPQKPARLSALAAAAQVLADAEEPLSCRQLIERMAERNLWKSPAGATPDRTLYSALMSEISKKGDQSRFERVAPGRFALRR